ncbi:hypothetical protein LNL84_11155 [Vibrio sp. ZSDZ34]|jgi:hypothetical protein|uniref:Uncharacterized protein n=1 Tax=Vibrio gelatinilyticus TaxID=2893468 RepID=A0A9X1WAI4_9VIBR|nr:hypothetical protein [Vibrio gelatinilyticus]MCJ2377387.1 hypothetical protein [Vibrio gelatinilyticus]
MKTKTFRYTPDDTIYALLYDNVQVKTDHYQWELGCVYMKIATREIFTRPYRLFNPKNWVEIEGKEYEHIDYF